MRQDKKQHTYTYIHNEYISILIIKGVPLQNMIKRNRFGSEYVNIPTKISNWDFISILDIRTCLLNIPKANYKVNTSNDDDNVIIIIIATSAELLSLGINIINTSLNNCTIFDEFGRYSCTKQAYVIHCERLQTPTASVKWNASSELGQSKFRVLKTMTRSQTSQSNS
jgi:hypothetical protein